MPPTRMLSASACLARRTRPWPTRARQVTASRTCASKSPACSPRRSTDGELAGVRARGVARTTRTGGGRGRIALSFLYELRSSLENENPRKNDIVFFRGGTSLRDAPRSRRERDAASSTWDGANLNAPALTTKYRRGSHVPGNDVNDVHFSRPFCSAHGASARRDSFPRCARPRPGVNCAPVFRASVVQGRAPEDKNRVRTSVYRERSVIGLSREVHLKIS